MKIEHRFSFFILKLSEKMNDPNIHALFSTLNVVWISSVNRFVNYKFIV